ncbi:ORF2 [Carrot Ch virus 2]|uniref:ORF2 n=1 Tax=Carrot Ch virus 2 TaxID=1425362 RepID=A0A0A0P507_9VIRU|nr:ORF2 [Carrot Ch virus 2]AHA85532.1 ORF2 [Carrot Ch virus 2]
MSLVDINKFCALVSKGASSVEAIDKGNIYGDSSWLKFNQVSAIRKFESNISIELDDGDKSLVIPNIPLVSSFEVATVKKSLKNANFLHLGGIVISIQALFAENKGVTGTAVLADKRWNNLDQAIIGAFHFNLDKRRADFIMRPNFDVSLNDPMLCDSISLMLKFENLDMQVSSIPINVSVGLIARFYNTIDPGIKFADEELKMQGLIEAEGIDKNDMLHSIGDLADTFSNPAIFNPTIVNNRKYDRGLFKDKGFIKQIRGSRSDDSKALRRVGRFNAPSSSRRFDQIKVDPLFYDKIKRGNINSWLNNELPKSSEREEERYSETGSEGRVEIVEH